VQALVFLTGEAREGRIFSGFILAVPLADMLPCPLPGVLQVLTQRENLAFTAHHPVPWDDRRGIELHQGTQPGNPGGNISIENIRITALKDQV
jgi:hypothetical protein